jgi:trigger factor
VALGLLVGEAIRVRDVKLDAARVEVALGEVAADYEEPEQVKQYYRTRQDLMQGLRAVVLEDQLVETLLAGAKVEEVPQSLEDLLKQQQQA